MCRKPAAALAATLILLSTGVSLAGDAKYDHRKSDGKEQAGVQWKATAQAGFIASTGNAKTSVASGGGSVSRRKGANRLKLEGSASYATAGIETATDANADMLIEASEVATVHSTTAQAWQLKSRYDRFFTAHNSFYQAIFGSADIPAGKEFVGGGQSGYSRQVYKTDKHEVVAEVGYDVRVEVPTTGDRLVIHSGRTFAGHTGRLSKDTNVETTLEVLLNINELDQAGETIEVLQDTRVNAKVGLTTKLYKNLSFHFGFALRYDNAPALRPAFSLPYAPGYRPRLEELDTKTEASLIVNFL